MRKHTRSIVCRRKIQKANDDLKYELSDGLGEYLEHQHRVTAIPNRLGDNPTTMHRRRLAFLLQSLGLATAHLITSPASLPYVTPIAYPGIGVGQDELFGRLPGRQLFKRASIPCDGNSFWCPTGTCFTATGASYSGLIGCCDVASCAPRTECIPYASGTTSPCDVNTGGCMYCSDSAAPACLTMTNVVDGQWIKVRATTMTC